MSDPGQTGTEVRRRVKGPSDFWCKKYNSNQNKEILEGAGETTGLNGDQPLKISKEQSGFSQQLGNAAEERNAEISEVDGSTTSEQSNTLQDLFRNKQKVLVKNGKKTQQQSMNNIMNEKKTNIVPALRLDDYPLGNFNNMRKFEIPDNILQCFRTQDQSQLLKLYPSLLNDLDASNYVEQFSVALWFQEIENNTRCRQFDLKNLILEPDTEGCCIIPVQKFSEFHPPILVGDLVGIYKTPNSSDMYKGPIQAISLNDKGIQCVHVRLPQQFNVVYDGRPWTIWFDSGRNSFRRTHFAVTEALKQLGPEWLFPTSLILTEPRFDYMEDPNDNLNPLIPQRTPSTLPLKWFNKKLNSEQKNAVKTILKGQSRPLPYIIFGPPGTGKTVTIVEAIMQFYFVEPTSRILVTAPSNVASDLITEQLVATNRFNPDDLVRLNDCTRRTPMSKTIAKFCVGIECLDIAVNSRLIVCTVVTAGQLFPLGLSTGHFDHLFIDEAGYCTEPEAMIPCVLAAVDKQTQVILAGDPQQPGPVLLSNSKCNKILKRSFLERLMSTKLYARDEENFPETKYNQNLITKLLRSYRADPVLLEIPSPNRETSDWDEDKDCYGQNTDITSRF